MISRLSYTIIGVLLFTFFISCKSTQTSTNEKAKLVISYYQTPGYSPVAPEYKLELYNNKQMYLTAMKNLDKEGKYMRTLSKDEYNQIIEAFSDASFFDFKDEYTDNITDLPTRYIQFTHKGQSKKIKDYYGAPQELKALELMVRSYLDRIGWSEMTW